MAKGEMDDFLKAYYRRLHAGAMDYDVLARLVDNKKKGLLTLEQESWFTDGFIVEDNDPQNKLGYRADDVPSLSDAEMLFDEEALKLYKRFAKAMAGMKTASALYTAKDADAKAFVKRYVDDLQIFPTPKATPECEDSIKNLIDLLDENGKSLEDQETIKNIKQIVVDETKKIDKPDEKLFNKTEDLNKLLQKCRDGKHNSDTSVQEKIQQVARQLDEYLNSYSWADNSDIENTKQKNKTFLGRISNDLSVIDREDAFSNIDVTDENLEKFKGGYGSEIMDILYHNKDIRDKFEAKDPKFVEIITKAEGKINYQDPNSDDYVKPKTEDVLTPVQQIEKWATDTYKNSIRKYARLRGDPLLFSGFSKEIFKALDKEDVKPTDGLNGLLDKAEAIKKRIPNKTVVEHFDWFVTTMNKIKADYPKAVEGAWKDGKQLNAIATEVILAATAPNAKEEDIEKAKTTMEIMHAMKYGAMSSKIMDAMKETDFNVFSDSSLSWNKNEGIQFVTKAFDKSVKAAFLGVGYGITFVRNKIMMSGLRTKFHDKDNTKNPALMARLKEEKARMSKAASAEKQHHDDANEKDNVKIAENQQILDDLKNNDNIDETSLDAKQIELDNLKADKESKQINLDAKKAEMEAKKATVESKKAAHDEYDKNKAVVDEYKSMPAKIKRLKKDQTGKLKEITSLRMKIRDMATYIDPLTHIQMGEVEMHNKEQELTEQLKQLESEYNTITDDLTACKQKRSRSYKNSTVNPAMARMTSLQNDENDYNTAVSEYEAAKNAFELAETDYNDSSNKFDDLNNKVQKFNDATKEVAELQKAIDDRDVAFDKWPETNKNRVLELENFWNFLQTGKANTWRLLTDKAQEKFDANKEALLAEYIKNHGLRAA